jgi:hypothetical protein
METKQNSVIYTKAFKKRKHGLIIDPSYISRGLIGRMTKIINNR